MWHPIVDSSDGISLFYILERSSFVLPFLPLRTRVAVPSVYSVFFLLRFMKSSRILISVYKFIFIFLKIHWQKSQLTQIASSKRIIVTNAKEFITFHFHFIENRIKMFIKNTFNIFYKQRHIFFSHRHLSARYIPNTYTEVSIVYKIKIAILIYVIDRFRFKQLKTTYNIFKISALTRV